MLRWIMPKIPLRWEPLENDDRDLEVGSFSAM